MALTLFWLNVKSAALCIRGVDGTALDGKTLRASFGTTKVRGFPNHHVPPYAIIAPDGRCAVLFDCTVRT
jgi:hypothetical protein